MCLMSVQCQSVHHQCSQKTSVCSVAMDCLHAQMVKYAASMDVDTHAFLTSQYSKGGADAEGLDCQFST
ncbi:hypothetical protein ACROYT_G036011 [Oculina patagonica]